MIEELCQIKAFIEKLKQYDCNMRIEIVAYRDLEWEICGKLEETTVSITQVEDKENQIKDFIIW